MAHKLQHTVQRGSSYYYNRRVPDRVADAFGLKVVRCNLGRDPERVAILSSGLTAKLDEVWSAERVMPLDVGRLVQTREPKPLRRSYLSLSPAHSQGPT